MDDALREDIRWMGNKAIENDPSLVFDLVFRLAVRPIASWFDLQLSFLHFSDTLAQCLDPFFALSQSIKQRRRSEARTFCSASRPNPFNHPFFEQASEQARYEYRVTARNRKYSVSCADPIT